MEESYTGKLAYVLIPDGESYEMFVDLATEMELGDTCDPDALFVKIFEMPMKDFPEAEAKRFLDVCNKLLVGRDVLLNFLYRLPDDRVNWHVAISSLPWTEEVQQKFFPLNITRRMLFGMLCPYFDKDKLVNFVSEEKEFENFTPHMYFGRAEQGRNYEHVKDVIHRTDHHTFCVLRVGFVQLDENDRLVKII